MTNNYFSNPNLIAAAKFAAESLVGLGRAYEDVVESLQDAVIETEKETYPFMENIRQSNTISSQNNLEEKSK
ncbi:MAG TPA: hypothetical protein DCG52_05080 [Alphaproteobacteria bacterium]|nr:hypothetical protein [Alphaproteobacteria bacterium]